jgi:hypothetical protein
MMNNMPELPKSRHRQNKGLVKEDRQGAMGRIAEMLEEGNVPGISGGERDGVEIADSLQDVFHNSPQLGGGHSRTLPFCSIRLVKSEGGVRGTTSNGTSSSFPAGYSITCQIDISCFRRPRCSATEQDQFGCAVSLCKRHDSIDLHRFPGNSHLGYPLFRILEGVLNYSLPQRICHQTEGRLMGSSLAIIHFSSSSSPFAIESLFTFVLQSLPRVFVFFKKNIEI